MKQKKKLFLLENGIFVEAKNTRALKKFIGDDYLFYMCEKEVNNFTTLEKLGDIFCKKKLKI
jgi:hypothetical protein